MRRYLRLFVAISATTSISGLTALADEAPTIPGVVTKMSGVAEDLGKTKTGEDVQKQQKAIIHDLDTLIAQLEKQCAACKNGIKKNNPNQGLKDSVIGRGTGGIGDLVNPGDSAKDWAKLSSRERDRILQSMSEGFPPEYRTVLERYYRRLAEEKSAANTTPKEKDKDQEQDKAPTEAKP
ncbi:hypothetical protein [Singulisphaera sp. PoT]|uniref:hypothetical protein n=1 Tax=Singulisphaera sp. PoT TaxID=3411797 RepID=UPI003BF500F0